MFGRLFECFWPTWECFTYIFTHLMTSPGRWRADLCSATVLQRATSNLSPPINCDIRSFCRTCDSGAVTTCFNDLGLSRLRYVYTTFSCRVNALTHCAIVAAKKLRSAPTPCNEMLPHNDKTLSLHNELLS